MIGGVIRCQYVFDQLIDKEGSTTEMVIESFLATLMDYNEGLSDDSF